MDFQRAIFPSTIVDHFYRTDIYARLPYKTNMITILSFTAIWSFCSEMFANLAAQHHHLPTTATIRKVTITSVRGGLQKIDNGRYWSDFSKVARRAHVSRNNDRLTSTTFGESSRWDLAFFLRLPICIY